MCECGCSQCCPKKYGFTLVWKELSPAVRRKKIEEYVAFLDAEGRWFPFAEGLSAEEINQKKREAAEDDILDEFPFRF